MTERVNIGGATFNLEDASVNTQRAYRLAKANGEAALAENDPVASKTALADLEKAQAAIVDELGAAALIKNTPARRLMPDGSVHPAPLGKVADARPQLRK